MLPWVSGAAPSMAMREYRRVVMRLDSPPACECVHHDEIARPVHGVQAEEAALGARQQALDLPLGVFLGGELQHAVDGEPRAVARYAHLRGAGEHAIARDDAPRRPARARV